MIKRVNINFPGFGTNGLVLEKEFKKGLNIIEEDNGYGKTTILNTIMSAFTFKFPGFGKGLPDGSVTIETDKGNLILSKKNWIGTMIESNDLYQYTMPGKFFEIKSTTEQRKVIVDLLGLDYNKFMEDECNKSVKEFPLLIWKEDLEKDLKDKIKDSETRSNIFVEDIMRLKSELINFDEKDFSDVTKYFSDKELIEDKIREYNKGIIQRQSDYNTLLRNIEGTKSDIKFIEGKIYDLKESNQSIDVQLDRLRKIYKESDRDAKCISCGSKLDGNKKQGILDSIVYDANKFKDQKIMNDKSIVDFHVILSQLNATLESLLRQEKEFDKDFSVMSYDDLLTAGVKFNIDIRISSKERLEEYEQYKNSLTERKRIQDELAYKEGQVKEINILVLQNNLNKLLEIKSLFTKKLEEATKDLPLDIQLFETLKNGSLRETFTINYNGIDYYNLSTGNKSIVNIMLAKIFVDKLGIDFILIDEGGLISKSNISYIKELANDYQVIICKAISWSLKDLK